MKILAGNSNRPLAEAIVACLHLQLTNASVNSAKGNFDGPRQNYQIDANDQITDAKEFNNVILAYRNEVGINAAPPLGCGATVEPPASPPNCAYDVHRELLDGRDPAPAYATELQNEIPGAQVTIIPDTGHMLYVEKADAVADAVVAFASR